MGTVTDREGKIYMMDVTTLDEDTREARRLQIEQNEEYVARAREIVRAFRLAPSGLSDDSGDALQSLATTIGVQKALMRLLLDGSVEAVRREDGEMAYMARSEVAESRAS